MTVEFALFVSPEGIALAHRQPKGHWALVAEARLDGDDLGAAMAGLKSAAADRGGADAPVVLVLPDDQVLYTSFMAPADDADLVTDRIVEGLDGMTPYAVADLVYDWRKVEEDRVKVAVVARETLDEASEFVAAHGFKAVGFAAMPPAERFPGMPLFGPESAGLGLDRGGLAFGSDDWVASAPEPLEAPTAAGAPEVAQDAAPASVEDSQTAEPTTASPEAPAAADPSETDRDRAGQAAAETTPTPPIEGARTPKLDAATAKDGEAIEAETGADTGAETGALAPFAFSDTTLEQPIAPLSDADTPWPEDEATQTTRAAARNVPPEPAMLDEAPEVRRDAGPQAPDPAVVPALPDEIPDDIPPIPTATRGRVAGPSTRPLTAPPKPDEIAPRRTDAPSVMAVNPREAVPGTEDTDGPDSATPALGFAARRGKAPKSTSGDIVSTRPSRLGFGNLPDPVDTAVLHPDAAPGTPAAGSARPGNLLAAQLARVRDASKIKPQPSVSPPARGRTAFDPPVESPAPEQTAVEAPDAVAENTAPSGYGFTRRRKTAPAPAASTGAVASGQNAFASGLLARKPTEAAGPSLRMGLILTLVLLVLLALIAIWSALFLPDSPIARLFASGSDRAAIEPIDEPGEAETPPIAVSAPPAMGALDARGSAPDAAPQMPDVDSATGPVAAETEAQVAQTEPALVEEVADIPLPDIDAELNLPPLPPLPEDLLPTLEETERIYAEDGIWPRTPDLPVLAGLGSANDIYVASIDPEVPITDAIALADPRLDPGELLRRVPPPPPFGATPDRDARGLIEPTPEGVLTPEGAFVVLGRPSVDAIPRPREVEPAAEVEPQADVEEAILGTFQPAPRPTDLEETRERQVQGGFSTTELAGLRPDPRPVSAQESAARASLFPQQSATDATPATDPAPDRQTAIETAVAAAVVQGTPLAITASRLPAARPANIEALVAAAVESPGPAVASESVARAPSIPSSADVTRAATERNAIRLRDVNLIGVTGTPNDRRALVRLPSGRFVRVGVGDRLDGGRVAAIGESSLQYVRNGRNVTLEIPG